MKLEGEREKMGDRLVMCLRILSIIRYIECFMIEEIRFVFNASNEGCVCIFYDRLMDILFRRDFYVGFNLCCILMY